MYFLEAIASLGVTFSLTHSVTQSLSHSVTHSLCRVTNLHFCHHTISSPQSLIILYNINNLLLLKWSKIKISNNYCQDCLQGYFDIKEIIFFVFKQVLRSSLYDLYFEMRSALCDLRGGQQTVIPLLIRGVTACG